ncbi:MAG: DUF2515 family protein [Bacillus sp. (in: firmicutes)]
MLGIFDCFPSRNEYKLVQKIQLITNKYNVDNISRTESYLHYYTANKEIRWAFLASQVSRNAGWNMCDLEGEWFPKILSKTKRQQLFSIYEKANWFIFQDAFPQLLLYHYSTKLKSPMFHLLKFFHVSSFMEREWKWFWERKDEERLMNSLIINEQNLIEKPIIKDNYFKQQVFHTSAFLFQDFFHFSAVLFPTLNGEIYGGSVSNFTSLNKRIKFGKTLASILFYPSLYPNFYQYSTSISHTGSRSDYERLVFPNHKNNTPILRLTYPIIKHEKYQMTDWSLHKKIKKEWLKSVYQQKIPNSFTNWYKGKQEQLHELIQLENQLLH